MSETQAREQQVSGGKFEAINEAKADLTEIYSQPDPRSYFRALKGLGYEIPQSAKAIFQRLIPELRREDGEIVRALDLGCSYGVNAALLKYDLSMPDLFRRWGEKQLSDLASDAVVERDRSYFADLDEASDLEVIGLDVAEEAVAFAAEVGLLDDGLALDLEATTLPDDAREELEGVDLVISTGCVGYVTEKTFDRLLPAVTQGRPAWMANFVLRMFPFEPIEQALQEANYVTEKLADRTFAQRRCVSAEERDQVLKQLAEQGLTPTQEEVDGVLIAEFYLSRPAAEVAARPLADLAAGR